MSGNRTSPIRDSQPSKKLGVKFLDQRQLDNTFPDWKALIDRIGEQRDISYFAAENQYSAEQGHLPQMYDNVYAILGGRGSGKSSVLLTLREQLRLHAPQDIMLPVITPEVISERECSILGWIMSAAETAVEETEHIIQTYGRPYVHDARYPWLDSFFTDCQFQKKDNGLRKRYQELFIQSVGREADISGYPVEDAVYYKVEQSRKQYQLIRDLNEFWRLLAETRAQADALKRSHEAGSSSKEEDAGKKLPLIILTFDDIDLVPERSMELLTTTFQYLTAPNIVIILTAEEDVLKEVIRLKMAERMSRSDADSLLRDVIPEEPSPCKKTGSTQGQSSPLANTAKEFYNKVIPPSSRYYLRHYQTLEERKLYSYSSTVQSFKPPKAESSTPIIKFLTDQIDDLLRCLRESSPEAYSRKKNFLQGDETSPMFKDAFLLMFGQKNRYIANGCLEIMNTVSRLQYMISACQGWKLQENNYREVLFSLRHLLKGLILSHPDLSDFAGRVETLLRPRLDAHWIYVDYLFVWDFYQQERTAIQSSLPQPDLSSTGEIKNSASIQFQFTERLGALKRRLCPLMVTLFFIEGILEILDSEDRGIHGYRELCSLLNADVEAKPVSGAPMRVLPLHGMIQDFLSRSYLLLEHADQYVNADIYNPRWAHAYLLDLFGPGVSQSSASKLLQSAVIKGDREWVTTVLMMLSVCYSGITLVDSQFVRISGSAQRTLELFSFGSRFNQFQKNAALDFLSNRSVSDHSKKLLEEFAERMDNAPEVISSSLIWEGVSSTEKKSLQSCFDWFTRLQEIENAHLAAGQIEGNGYTPKTEQYLYAYAAQHWNHLLSNEESRDSSEPLSKKEALMVLSHQIVYFFLLRMENCIRTICHRTAVFLSHSGLEELRALLWRMDEYDHELRRKRDALLRRIDQVLSYRSTDKPEDENKDDARTFILPSGIVIEYLNALQTMLFTPDMKPRDLPFFYDASEIQTYFKLLRYLTLMEDPQKEIVPRLPSDTNLAPDSPCVSIVNDLKMLELLMPYYFAASTWISQSTRYRSELLWSEDGVMPESADQALKRLFDELTSTEKSPKGKARKQLMELMREAQNELADQYYSRLEASYE